MEKSSVKHIMNNEYCYALDNNRILIKISLKAGDVKDIYLHYLDKYLQNKSSHKKTKMTLVASDGLCDYYEAIIQVNMLCVRYFFEFLSSNKDNTSNIHTFYGNNRFFSQEITDISYMYDCPQPVKIEEKYDIPDWAKGAVVYEIFPERFATTKPLTSKWYKTPMANNSMLGGTIY